MNDPAWDRLVDAVELKGELTDHGSYSEPLEDKPDLKQDIRFICFKRGDQEYKLERVTRPRVLERKSLYHRAASAGVTFENIYDPDDLVQHTNFYIKKSGEWQVLDPDSLDLS